MAQTVQLEVVVADILEAKADVLALKFAQGFHGADLAVADALEQRGVRARTLRLRPGQHRILETSEAIGAARTLYVGVPRLGAFRYEQIRDFAFSVLSILAEELPTTSTLAMTIHGPGYGLDEGESALAQIGGFLDALDAGTVPPSLRSITICELRPDRADRIWRALERQFATMPNVQGVPGRRAFQISTADRVGRKAEASSPPKIETAGADSEAKPHAFVAMPFTKNMDDVYYYGIVQPVNAAGLLCERVDEASFTGHILDQIRERIETATVVIADLTSANPNVYLEVGYAWGRQKPTILLVQKVEDLRFDVAGQRCLIYERILDLEQCLAKELRHLQSKGVIPATPKDQGS